MPQKTNGTETTNTDPRILDILQSLSVRLDKMENREVPPAPSAPPVLETRGKGKVLHQTSPRPSSAGTLIHGTNLIVTEDGADLLIRIPNYQTADFGPSSTGKSRTVASSHGNRTVGNVKIGLNVYRS